MYLNKDKLLTYNAYHVSEQGRYHRICPEHAGFLCNKAAVLGDRIRDTFRRRKLKSLVLFEICGSVHHGEINKTTYMMQLGAIVFIIPGIALYMFRVLFAPIIRSALKLYMQLLVQSRTLPTPDHLLTD